MAIPAVITNIRRKRRKRKRKSQMSWSTLY
jgi:hypothetical protein